MKVNLYQETLYTETITRSILGHRPENKEYVTPAERKVTCSIAAQREEEKIFRKDDHRDYDFDIDCKRKNSVVGCLKKNLAFWKNNLQASNFVQNVIEKGYIIPFLTVPPAFYAKNNKSSLDHQSFVEEAIRSLIDKGCITEVKEMPKCCNPLTVANKNSKLRLVLDLRHVNQYVNLNKIKYEDLNTFTELFEQGDFFITFDLTSGYHHVDIHPEHKKYLGFSWVFNNNKKFFVFNVLPFGLNSACYVFTKLLRPYIKKWRGEGIKTIIFIDDGICGGDSFEYTSEITKIVINDLKAGGWDVNFEKSKLTPTQKGKWLGIIIDTRDTTFTVPPEKINKLMKNIKSILVQTFCSAKQLSKIAGQLASMHLAIGPIVRLMTRNLYVLIESRSTWYQPITLTENAVNELQFWLENIQQRNGITFKPRPTTSKIMFTDASDSGYGGFIAERLGNTVCVGKFQEKERDESSTTRELTAVKYVLGSFGSILQNESIQINVDNLNACRILSVGSSKQHLQSLALDIFLYCLLHNIRLQPHWVPREENEIADYYSKYNDTDDWSIDKINFNNISKRFGPFTIDRFADNLNRQTSRFNSKFYCPQTEDVNCFTKDWKGENNFLCPPISLIGSTIRHLRICQASGTLVIPVWPTAYFWALIYLRGKTIATFVKNFYVFDPIFESN